MDQVSRWLSHQARNITSLPVPYTFTIIMIVVLALYLLSKGQSSEQNHFVYLADAFLHGSLSLSGHGITLNEVVPYHGSYYVVYPPMPAVLLIPFVAAYGTAFDQALLSTLLASIAVPCTWLMLRKTGSNPEKALWLTALFGFGTCLWFTAVVGSSWYIEHVSAVLFLTTAILLTLYRKNNFIIGLVLGFAALSRLPVVLSLPFFLLMIYDQQDAWRPRIREFACLLAGLAIPLALNEVYNYLRYGVFYDIGYTLIPGIESDPYYTLGIFDISYIPRHIYAIFFQGPTLLNSFPYFEPSWMGLGLFFTTPAFIYIFMGKWDRLSIKAGIAVLCILPVLITHGTVGFTQFGYRFSLDFIPFLMLLTAKGMKEILDWKEKSLIILSILINLWGVMMLLHGGLYGFPF